VRLHKEILRQRPEARECVVVGIAALVEDGAAELPHKDVRCEHLSWDKFKEILRTTDEEFGIGAGGRGVARRLFWREVLERESKEEFPDEIETEKGFQQAIGLLDWRSKFSKGPTLPFVMEVRHEYLY